MDTRHKNRCDNGCIRRMNTPEIGKGQFAYYQGTLDCPAQVEPESCEFETISLCGCCSFEDGSETKTADECRFKSSNNEWAECGCHNTLIVYTTCLSKRCHGACPYGFKVGED